MTDSFAAAARRSDDIWARLRTDPTGFRVLTGERTTGALHIGHYFGSLQNRVALQGMGVEMFLVMADYQAITDRDADDAIADSVRNILLDYLAIGMDPETTTIFTHSMVSALNQLLLPFLSVVTMAELQRNPTVKDEIALTGGRAVSGLMMTYPVHQAADILFCKGNLVPGGKDQLPHIEVTRTIARRMNSTYFGRDYFPEPDLLISETPLLLGTDGRKMGKSLNNAIYLRSTADETLALVRRAKTDAERSITYDPDARPEVANLLRILSACTDRTPESWAQTLGDGGGGELKRVLAEALNDFFAPIRARRQVWERDLDGAMAVLRAGVKHANALADDTLDDVRKAMRMDYFD
ncbi:tryptophan--tRNA ligase [Cellulomonas sp. Root485]|jgi:tryptophanyl-tRNA synthetase|uniref:tryptophan--tRNA ligase n=1 Tax=Cellulomonas sp. Root485 TaxID=1736546 RepID=UPI0006F48E15|nr:tryptophan--tRNA ligase [Cellulomonas sp. Root485]KQY22298.1 tryptophan--tRNA ligase [Cellulomonas sp. Root485]